MKNFYTSLCLIICFTIANTFAQNSSTIQLSIDQFPKAIKQNSTAKIKLTVANIGKEINQNVIVKYAIDDNIIASQKMTLSILELKTQEIEYTHEFNLPIKEHKLKIWITDEFNNDLNRSLNEVEVDFLVARVTVPQLPLIEEFTSSTCGPCASFNNTFDPFLSSINANENGGQVAAIKYQMNWPSPDDDPSYNSDGNGRKNSYAVGGIPKSYLNGVATSTFNQSVITAASGESAFNLVPYYYFSGDTLKATGTATSYTTMSTTLRLHLAITEDFYSYSGGTTSQTTFHYVERKMLPNYVGTVLTNIHEDTTYTTNRNYKLTYGNVTQNSYNIWGTSTGITLVSWIQNTDTKEIYQAAFTNTPSALGLQAQTVENSMEVFPNPANENFTIKLELIEKAEVSYFINDLSGKLIQAPIVQELPAGKHVLQTSTVNLLPGIYLCNIKANNKTYTERIVVTK
jgi:hypothetical protein